MKQELDKMKRSIMKADIVYFDSYLCKNSKIIENNLNEHFIINCEMYDIPKIDFNSNKITDIKKIGTGKWEIYFYIKNMEQVFSIIETMKLTPFEDK